MENTTPLMLAIAVVVGGLVALATVGFLLQQRRRPKPRTEIDFETAWRAWFGDKADWSGRERGAVERLEARGDTATDELKRSLAAAIDQALASPEPTLVLRRSIMDAADHCVLAETLCCDDKAAIDASESIVTIGVLRRFSRLRFHDWAQDDWYAHYLQVAEMNAKNVGAMVRKTVSGDAAAMETALHDPLAATMRQVRERLLHHPPRTPVTRADELTQPDAQERLHPSQKQVDLLTSTMRKRFDKLFAGQVYNLPGAPPVNPVGAFHVDAGLLYAVLSSYFRYPKDAWRKIMLEALGPYKSAMQNEELLLEHATALSLAWSGATDGALTAAIESSWAWAFESAADGSAPVDESLVVAGMVEHAGPLVGAIRNVIEKH